MASAKTTTATAAPPRLTVSIGTLFTLASNPGHPRLGNLSQRPLPRAVITLRGTTTSATTNRYGHATFTTSALVGTGRVLEVAPQGNAVSASPAGPTHGSGGHASAPDFMFRPFSVTVDVDATGFLSTPAPSVSMITPAGSPPHAAVLSLTSRSLVLDCKPDWMKSNKRYAMSPKVNSFLVFHQTGGDSIGSVLNTYVPVPSSASALCAHYVIDVDGHAVKLVHESDRVNHTGPAFWDGDKRVNAHSIGIEIVHSDSAGLHNYEDAQYVTVLRLAREIRAAHPTITRQHVVGHSDVECVSGADLTIGRDRPEDPGEAFDWNRFEAANQARTRTAGPPAPTVYNIGPGQTVKATGQRTPPTLAPDYSALQADLSAIGYSIASDGVTASGAWDRATQQAVNRFQRRYFSGGHRSLRPVDFVIGTLDYTTAVAIASVAGDTGP